MGGTKCLRLGTCELKDMGGVLQKNSSITVPLTYTSYGYGYATGTTVHGARCKP